MTTPEPEQCGAPGIAGPCILPPGHDESFHEDQGGKYWLVDADAPSLLQGSPTAGSSEPGSWCGASTRTGHDHPAAWVGPCVLRHGHDGPVHQDADGSQWTDPQPATGAASAAYCPPTLRDQLRDAIRQAPENDDPPNGLSRSVHPATDGDYELISGPPGDFADTVMPVVEAALAQLETEIDDHIIKPERALHEQTIQRAEQAERQRDTAREALNAAAIVIASLRDQRDEQRQRTENAEMEGRNILRRLDIADRLAGALEDERDKARRERDEERVIRQQAEEIIAIAHDTSNQAERARQAAERALAQALNAIADERRGRLAAEAAVRRGREIHRRHDCARHVSAHTPVPCVNEGLCDGCAARYPCQTATALEAEQPKETP